MSTAQEAQERVAQFRAEFQKLEAEVGKMIVGHKETVRGVLVAIFAGGHCLLEGLPGLGKTMLVRTLGEVLQLRFNRVQFTPDLMPADILGTNLVSQTETGERVFRFQKGPIFTQILLADEINRATPKTQSALLEAMQEHRVTVAGTTYPLDPPFFVLATQNPIEMEGTYPLPEAQLDRFLFKLIVTFSSVDELREILERTTETKTIELARVMDGPAILRARELVRSVVTAPHVKDYIARLVWATHRDSELAPEMVKKYVRFGASPRGAQALATASKVNALIEGRYNVGFDDVKTVAMGALRHRVLLNFEGEAEGIKTEQVVAQILASVTTEIREPAVKKT
jgi:MoxR-like ATPase